MANPTDPNYDPTVPQSHPNPGEYSGVSSLPVSSVPGDVVVRESAALERIVTSPNSVVEVPPVNPKWANDPNIGQVFGGKYIIDRVLGEGGMGIVYLAKHKAIGKRFAIKLLHGDALKDPEVVERFKVEAQAASAIGNEHIIDITDFAELPDGSTYFVMEFLDGRSVTALFTELKRLPTQRLARIAKQITQGLGAAHQAGIIHRDLKPDNIHLCRRSGGEVDFVKILDFGIAKVGQSSNKLTKAGAIFGTPHYMSPEQAAGSPIDHRTDIYALGVILYEGAVGRVPFDADNFMGILTQHMYKAPVPPRAVPECPSDLSPGLEVIIMRCLRKKPEERYQTMEELEEDLDRLLRGEVPKAAQDMMALSAGYQSLAQSALAASAMPKPVPGEPPHGKKKAPWPLYAGIAGVFAAIGIAAVVLVGPSKTNADGGNNKKQTDEQTDEKPAKKVATTATTQAASTAAPTKKTRMVLITSVNGAKIYDGDTMLSEEPFNYELEEGASKTLVVKAPGFKDSSVTLDAKSPAKVNVNLVKSAGVPAAPVKKTGGSEADDPWAKK